MLLLGLVERMNGLRLGAGATVEERTAFHRVATLLAQFRERGIGLWVQESGATGRYELILSHYSPGRIAEVEEFLRLLELHGNPAQESTIRIPVALGVRDGNFDGLAVQTRSVAEILHSGGVDRGAWRACQGGPRGGALGPCRGSETDPADPFEQKRPSRPTSPCSIAAGGTMWTTRTLQVNGRSCTSRRSS